MKWDKKCNIYETIDKKEIECKVIVAGESRSGKTCLVHRYIKNQFPQVYVPTGFEKYSSSLELGGYQFNLTIWDTSGLNSYDSVRPLAYQDGTVFILCFHLGDLNSLQMIAKKWHPEVRSRCPDAPIILCGCQSDRRLPEIPAMCTISSKPKQRPVFAEEALDVCRQIGAVTYVETSSLTNGQSVREAMEVTLLAAVGKLNNNSNKKPSDQSRDGTSRSKKSLSKSMSTNSLNRCKTYMKLRKCKSKVDFKDHQTDKKCSIM